MRTIKEIFLNIIKKQRIENKKIDIKYNKIKNQKIKEWFQKKILNQL